MPKAIKIKAKNVLKFRVVKAAKDAVTPAKKYSSRVQNKDKHRESEGE